MKTIKLSILSFGILFGTAVFAQDNNKNQLSQNKLSKEQRMEKRMDNFGQELDLTAAQKEKITEIRKNTIAERQKLINDQSIDESNKGLAMKALRLKEKEEISKTLTDEQTLKFQSIKENRKENYKNRDHKYQNKKYNHQRQSGKKLHKSDKQMKKLAPIKE